MIACRSLLAAATLAAAAASPPAAAQAAAGDHHSTQDLPTLTVAGEAVLDKPADQLRLRLGVVTQDAHAGEAMAANSRQMDDVIKAVRKTGLEQSEYQTSGFSLQPVYSQRPRTAGADWQPRIVGYRVTNSLSIRTKKLDLAGRLMEAANEAGANTIDSVDFDLADPRAHRAEAITVAARNARADAATLAEASGVKLLRVLSITLNDAGWRPPVPTMAMGRMAMAEGAPPPMEPGTVTVRAAVTIVYEIGPEGR